MKDRNRSGKSGLIEKITKDSIKVELWISVSKWALPALGVGFLALFTWVWQTHADIVSIREQHVHAEKKLDSIEQRIAGRYTIDHAREDQRHSSKRMDAQVAELRREVVRMRTDDFVQSSACQPVLRLTRD